MSNHKKMIEHIRKRTIEQLCWPTEELVKYLERIHGPKSRVISGPEAEHLLVIFKLIGHYASVSNQRTQTYVYIHADKEYHVTYGLGDDPLVEEIIDE